MITREMVKTMIRTQGEKILRSKGRMTLSNKLKARIMEPDDREYLARRNEWVAERLKSVIASGRADKPGKTKRRSPFASRIVIPW